MDPKEYEKRIAKLESLNDQLTAEFTYLDAVLKKLGFEEGIVTLKEAAAEMLEKKPIEDTDDQ